LYSPNIGYTSFITTSTQTKDATASPARAARPKPVKKAAKKGAEKKAPAAAAPKVVEESPFHANSAKTKLFDVLKDGKVHTRESIVALCDKLNVGHGRIRWALRNLATLGWTINADRESIEILPPRKK
jgi:hypothetical protein